MKKNNSTKDPVELLIEDLNEVSSAFSTRLDSLFDDVEKSVDRIFSTNKEDISTSKNEEKSK
ncbi:MAG: hypothetical protein ACKVKJ_07130 [Fidelibacterota bacterium]|jgi:hypothetical protein|nr:hypothetical protein [Candidatus Neomarinimicrobiota bacterium]MDB9884914.1 hypothetical protein [Candidatus Neomarinimicrobiota bacterium]|tara:strand:+ start:621 stop:806 length:186 start_codon:yes stop_codon:yes gene_type:complete